MLHLNFTVSRFHVSSLFCYSQTMTADTPSILVIFNAQIVPRLQIEPIALGHTEVVR